MFTASTGSIVLVHGTGVRLKSFQATYEIARSLAASCGLPQQFVPCAWGDPLGVEFEGKSLPDPPSKRARELEEDEEAQWNWLLGDPFFELVLLGIPSKSIAHAESPSQMPDWERLWKRIESYEATLELQLLLQREGLKSLWRPAWSAVIDADSARAAFEASVGELPEACRALARCAVARVHVEAAANHVSGPSARLREKLVERLLLDWGQQVHGIADFFLGLIQRSGTRFIRNRRELIQGAATLAIGDVLLYQSNGSVVRSFIRAKIECAPPPVTLIGHSLGGIACVDLLALPHPPAVTNLVTIGSQGSFFTEIGALQALKQGARLPDTFPRWLNIFDRSDFLSFVCARIFPQVLDLEIPSGQPFPESHSAYFSNELVWTAIRSFVGEGAGCRQS